MPAGKFFDNLPLDIRYWVFAMGWKGAPRALCRGKAAGRCSTKDLSRVSGYQSIETVVSKRMWNSGKGLGRW